MISRREFLVGGGAAITLATVDRFQNFLEKRGEPLIEAPKRAKDVLYVDREADFQIGLNGVPGFIDCPFENTLAYLKDGWGISDPTSLSDFRAIHRDHGYRPKELFEEVPWETWCSHLENCDGPDSDAFYRLAGLDLDEQHPKGSNQIAVGKRHVGLDDEDGVVGGLTLHNEASLGGWFSGVHADDDISLSLLQHRLTQLGAEIAVKIHR